MSAKDGESTFCSVKFIRQHQAKSGQTLSGLWYIHIWNADVIQRS